MMSVTGSEELVDVSQPHKTHIKKHSLALVNQGQVSGVFCPFSFLAEYGIVQVYLPFMMIIIIQIN